MKGDNNNEKDFASFSDRDFAFLFHLRSGGSFNFFGSRDV